MPQPARAPRQQRSSHTQKPRGIGLPVVFSDHRKRGCVYVVFSDHRKQATLRAVIPLTLGDDDVFAFLTQSHSEHFFMAFYKAPIMLPSRYPADFIQLPAATQ